MALELEGRELEMNIQSRLTDIFYKMMMIKLLEAFVLLTLGDPFGVDVPLNFDITHSHSHSAVLMLRSHCQQASGVFFIFGGKSSDLVV